MVLRNFMGACLVFSSVVGAANAASAEDIRPPIPLLRAEEDNSWRIENDVQVDAFDRFKYIPLADDGRTYLSFGGETRLRYENSQAPAYGLTGAEDDGYLFTRILMHGDLRLASGFRVFAQMSHHDAMDKKNIRSIDENDVDLQQAFIEVPVGDSTKLRMGRQEMLLGSGRFTQLREGPNIHLTYDGVRAFIEASEDTQVSVFAVRPTSLQAGSFNDEADSTQFFYGGYASHALNDAVTLDGYFYGLEKENVTLSGISGDEYRYTVGSRLWGKYARYDYDVEGIAQFGHVGDAEVRAAGMSSKFGYTFDREWQSRLGVNADIFSGDDDPNDSKIGGVNPLFPFGGYFETPGYSAFTNIVSVGPSIEVKPVDALKLHASVRPRWRMSKNDAVYTAPATSIAGTAGVGSAYVATHTWLGADWRVNHNLKLGASYVHANVADWIKDIGGENGQHVAVWASLKF